MSQQVRILIVEEDEYALNFMSLLIQRDRRTRVAGQVRRPADIPGFLGHTPVDLILLGGDPPTADFFTNNHFQLLQQVHRAPPFIVAGSQCFHHSFATWNEFGCRGWLIKEEIGYSLSWALILAARGEWVVTPGVTCETLNNRFLMERHPIILEGSTQITGLTVKEAEQARLAFLFPFKKEDSIKTYPQNQIDDTCRKLGLSTHSLMMNSPNQCFTGKEHILHYFGDQLEQIWSTALRENNLTDLVFLLLTLPEIYDQTVFHP